MNNHLEDSFNEEQLDDRIRRYGRPYNNVQKDHKCLLIVLGVISVIFFFIIIFLLYLLYNKNEYISFLEYGVFKLYNENDNLKKLLMEIITEYNNLCDQLNCLTDQNEKLNSEIQDAYRMIDSTNHQPEINIHQDHHHPCVIF